MIRLEKLTLKFNKQTVIKDLSFTFEDGKFYGITGASGIGKTTLINAVAGLVSAHSGRLGHDFEKLSYIFQDARLFPHLTALENVDCVCHDRQRAEYYLSLLLPEGADKYPDELSGGMKQRVSIARALAYDAPLVLLDEPFKGFDAETKQATINLVCEHLRGRCAILVSHEQSELDLCDEVYRLEGNPVNELKKVR